MSNRIQQLKASELSHGLLFYVWFDEQAGNLNLNFITANHERLPFRADLEHVDSLDIILNEFLTSKYLEGIPFEDLSDDVASMGESISDPVLKVYQKKLM